jgi:hypothetical protein
MANIKQGPDVSGRKRTPKGSGKKSGEFEAEIFAKGPLISDDDFVDSPAAVAVDTRAAKKSDVAAGLMANLREKIASIDTAEEWQKTLAFFGDFHQYSFNNSILIKIQCPEARRVASYKKWQEKGFQVKKGSTAIRVLKPILVDDEDKPKDPVTGKYPKKLVNFAGVPVFDISQTEEIPGVEHDVGFVRHARELARPGEEPDGMRDALVAECEKYGYAVKYEERSLYAAVGSTNWMTKEVTIASNASPIAQMEILAHELGHIAMGHTSEEELKSYHSKEGGERDRMEVEAESVSYMLCNAWGLPNKDKSPAFDYIKGWATKRPELITSVAKKVADVAKKLPFPDDEVA